MKIAFQLNLIVEKKRVLSHVSLGDATVRLSADNILKQSRHLMLNSDKNGQNANKVFNAYNQ